MDERLFTVEVGEDVIENASLNEVLAFLAEKASDYNITWLVKHIKDESRLNQEFYLPRLEKKDFDDNWYTPTEEYIKNSIHCCFWRTR
jgi:hypothetical protein